MHDSQIEDRLRTVLRAEGEALPLTITPDELVRRLALRRRERNGRRMGMLAAVLAVIALGSLVATTAGWIRMPAVGSGPEASPQPLETPYQSLGPTATPLTGILRFDAPVLTMIQGASDARDAKARCPSYQLASGAWADDQCGAPYEPITDIAPLGVPWVEGAGANTLVFILSDSWQINQARVTAVQANLVASGSLAPEYSVAFVDQRGSSLAIPIPLDPGTWILRVSLNGSKGGDTFGAYYDLPLQVGPPK